MLECSAAVLQIGLGQVLDSEAFLLCVGFGFGLGLDGLRGLL